MTKRFLVAALLASACIAFVHPALFAADWPQWRGPRRDGVSTETGLLKSWPEGGPAVLWTAKGLGEGYATVSIKDNRIYTMGTSDGGEAVFALDANTGRQAWVSKVADKVFNEGTGNGPRSTPTTDGDMLYSEDSFGTVSCLKASDGECQWKVSLLTLGGKRPHWGYSESPLVVDDMLIVTPGRGQGAIAALDKKSGKTLWQSADATASPAYASPVVAAIAGRRQIINGLAERMVSVDAATGKLLWDFTEGIAEICCTTPVVVGDIVVGTSGYRKGTSAVRVTATGIEKLWFEPGFGNHHGGVVAVNGYLYGFFDEARGSSLKCVEAKTGKVMWSDPSVGKGSVTCADGMLICLSERNVVGLVKASPDGYSELGRFKIADSGRPSWAHPVVANGRLYIRNQDTLTCYDVTAR